MNDPTRLMEASLHNGAQTLARLSQTWQSAIADAQAARDPVALGTIPLRLLTEQTACLMQSSSAAFDLWFGDSARVLAQAPRAANGVAQQFGLPVNLDLSDDAVYAPLAAIETVRSNWSYCLHQWAQTLRGGPPAP